MRIAIGGFQHESHSFAPLPTGWKEFLTPGGFPGLQRPARLVETLRPTSVPCAGAIEVLEGAGVEIVPLTWCFANPAGPVTAEAFERIAALMLGALSDALEEGPLDGVYLELHGAMVAVGFDDAEGELLRRVRAVVGPDLPLTVSLDPHANMTRRMVDLADALVPYRTYPHVDMKPAGAQAARLLLERIRRGRPWARAFAEIDFLIPLTMQCTLVPPMSLVLEERARLEAAHGCAELAFCFGFPYADFPGCGVAIAAYAGDAAQAEAAVAGLKAYLDAHEPDFAGGVAGAAEGVAEAIAVARGAARPVVMADTQDNPGGGGHGDTTGLLAELIRQDAQGAVLGLINDAESAAACHAAGRGATLQLSLGGRSDGAPLPVTAVVEALTDGRFTCTGPMGKGNPADLGPTALIRVSSGVRVIVVTRKMQALDQALFTHIGVEPSEQRILALKSSVHFRAHFQPIAERVIVVAAPGPVVADPAVLPFTRLRPGLRLRPGANR
ncbi:M81 family metallopeptidase [Paracraurococcus lichenis]|uniref:Microcystinase C n=1 Tax=Paracraurococcus lichenis TaxID=3064888 RepID=A0ABT9DVV0_9PROT|nr:M81 family metallopeptidase [Paracraurococcus sp. LOR1-02]MDO9707925.1 M81 family metallopeptidase [Paracraurococcus sp. LOR1-02]